MRLRRSRISLPVLKNGTHFLSTATCAPVRGLRPVRAGRCLTENAPKPRNSTRSPRDIAATISPSMALTIFSTSRWYRWGFCAEIRCTSSDLIIARPANAASPVDPARRRKKRSVRIGRVPKGQKTVKIETLHRTPFETVGQRAQSHRIEERERRSVQEGEVAEATVQIIVAHRQVGVDVLFLAEPGQPGALIAKLVDQF